MDTITFVRKPFVVQAVEVTLENMEEIAKDIGKLRKDENDKPYIYVDRRIVQNAYKVWPGFWVTYMGDKIHCYSRKAFNEQFIQKTPYIEQVLRGSGLLNVTDEKPTPNGNLEQEEVSASREF